ncbi:MAG: ABC transporter substrate-binding protein/permease [Segniliparus sp.]|uniref:ABC transporter substrate-binding protein/permease n=1 Tax=Segniliparus sp. TaxID=2804064 RepID=UPI003F32ACC9
MEPAIRRHALALFAVLCLVWNIALVPAQAEPALRFGTEGTYAPFSYHDPGAGELVGYDVEVAKAVAAKLGRRAEFVEAPWDTLFAGLDAGQFEFIANQVEANPQREQLYSFSTPYTYATGVVIVRAGDTAIHTPQDLRGKLTAGTSTSNWTQAARALGARVEEVAGTAEALALLAQGRVDAVLNDDVTFRSYLVAVPDAKIKIGAELPERSAIAFPALRGSTLVGQVDAALADLKADGTLTRISEKYLHVDVSGSQAKPPSQWSTIRANLWPMARALAKVTLPLAAITFAAGLVIALVTALARISSNRAASFAARAYISAIRGTPLLVQLFLIYYALPEFGIKLPPFPAAAAALSLNVGGYAAEAIRGAILAVPDGQWEASSALGLSRGETLRLVVLPQALRIAVPPLSNILVALVKDTSLAATIQVTELFRTAQNAAAPTFRFFALYLTAAVFYWAACLVLSWLQGRLERRLERGTAKA